MRNNGFMLFDTETEINVPTGRPAAQHITNWTIGIGHGFSNLGTQAQAVAGIPIDVITEKIKIQTTKYKMQRNLLAQDMCGRWKLWVVKKPEDVVPRNPNLINLVFQEQTNVNVFKMALEFYEEKKGGCGCHA